MKGVAGRIRDKFSSGRREKERGILLRSGPPYGPWVL